MNTGDIRFSTYESSMNFSNNDIDTEMLLQKQDEENLFEFSDVDYQKQVSLVDDVYNFLNTTVPDIVLEKVPKSYSLQTESAYDFIVDNELAFEQLPRTEDGKIDVVEIKSALEKSVSLITEQNNQAQEIMDYGIYREAINNTNLLVALLGPEVANVVLTYGGDDVPSWAKEGISIFQIINDDVMNPKNEALADIKDFLDVKTSVEIREKIDSQETALEKLKNFEINDEEDARKFLEAYLNLTGTSFFCDKIDQCYELYNTEDSSEKDKIVAYQKACGSSKNLADAQKNRILTDVCYEIGIKYLIPVAINKIDTIPTKIVSTALPTQIELTETATQGREDGQLINFSQFDYNTMVDILAEGAVDGLFVNLNGVYKNEIGFKNKAKAKGEKFGMSKILNGISKFSIKSVIPNYSSLDKAILSLLLPGSGAFMK